MEEILNGKLQFLCSAPLELIISMGIKDSSGMKWVNEIFDVRSYNEEN